MLLILKILATDLKVFLPFSPSDVNFTLGPSEIVLQLRGAGFFVGFFVVVVWSLSYTVFCYLPWSPCSLTGYWSHSPAVATFLI